jgi:pyruvate dehydrogenase (quinone)
MAQIVGSYLVNLMIRSGVRNIYGIVGDSANPVIDAIRQSDGKLKFINVRNEEAGAFAAGADSQVSGRPTAVIGSSGPGSLHLLNGLYDCARNGASVFAIATHIPTTEIGTNYFQETRPDQIFLDCAKYIGYVTSAAQMPRIAELAMQAAILERGIGMIILPGDVSAAPIEHPMLEHPITTERSCVRPPDRDLDRVADLIAKSKRMAIFGGAGCAEARAEVLQLSQLLHAPVGFTFRGKDILEAANPNAVGMTGLLGWGGAHAAIAECDLLLMLGTDFPYHPFMPEKSTIIQIDEQAGHLGRRAKVDIGLVGDVGETLKALLPRLRQRSGRDFLDKILVIHRKAAEDLQTYVTHPGGGKGLRPEMVASAISKFAADDAIFSVDTGMCNVWGARYITMRKGQRMLGSFGHGSMANAMPQAIGASLGTGRQSIALCGDGGFTMLMGELLTAAELDLPVKLMIFNNSTRGMVRAEMEVSGYVPWGTDVKNPNFGAVAQAMGIHGERVETPGDIEPAIQRALEHKGPALVDFVTDPSALSMPPKVTFEQVRGYALAMGKLVFGGNTTELLETVASNIRDVKQVL